MEENINQSNQEKQDNQIKEAGNTDVNASTKPKKKSSLVKKGLSLSVLTLFSRILGLLRQMTQAKFLGTTALSDAFGVAFQIPNLFRRLFAENSISVAFIPTFKGYLEDIKSKEGKQKAQDFVSATFTLVTFATVAFVTLGIILTPLILKIYYKKADAASMAEATVLTRIMFPYLVVISIAAFLQGILNGMKIFSPSGFTPILFNAIVIATTYIFAPHMKNPARAMSLGVIIGGSVQALFQVPFVLKNKWALTLTSLKKSLSNPGTRKVLALIGPTILGMAAYQLNDIVSSALATRTGEGIYSSLSYSLRLQELILGICAVTIGTVILPDLTGFAKNLQWDKFNQMLVQSIRIMAFIAIPVTFYSLCMDRSLISLLFQTGRFDEQSIEMTVQVFRCHIVGLYFIALNRIVAPAFYAQQDTISPTVAGLVNFAVNMILAIILSKVMGGPGIALALTIASGANTLLLFVFLRKNQNVAVKKIIADTLLYTFRMIVFSVVASLPVMLLKVNILRIFEGHSRFISQGFPIAITAILFGAVGLALMFITRDPLLKNLTKKFKFGSKR